MDMILNEDKTLRVTIPSMKRVHNSTIPYAGGTDEDALRNNAGVHLRGTGFPWQRQANVFIAGHRLGYVGTPSTLPDYSRRLIVQAERVS
jgi:sortase A